MQKIAQRYAKALFQLASTPEEKEQFLTNLQSFKDWAVGSTVFSTLMTNRFIPKDVVAETVHLLCDKAKMSVSVSNFVRYVIEQGRWNIFSDIIEAYIALYQDTHNIKRAEVETAHPLTKDLEESFVTHLESLFKTKLVLQYKVDASLMGGFRAQVGSRQLDSSLKTQLLQLNRKLKGIT